MLAAYVVDTLWGHTETLVCTVATVVLAVAIDSVWRHGHPSSPAPAEPPATAPSVPGRPV